MECQNQTLNLLQSKINLFLCMCVLFHFSFVCTSAYANVYFKTAFNQHSCVRGPLRECRSIRSGASGLSYYCAPLVCVSAALESLALWRHYKPKTKNQSIWGNPWDEWGSSDRTWGTSRDFEVPKGRYF